MLYYYRCFPYKALDWGGAMHTTSPFIHSNIERKTMDSLEKRKLIIEQASKIVEGARQLNYGAPEDTFGRIAALWETYLLHRKVKDLWLINSNDVCIMMMLMKIARLMNTPDHWDSIKDVIGYATCMASFVDDSKIEKE